MVHAYREQESPQAAYKRQDHNIFFISAHTGQTHSQQASQLAVTTTMRYHHLVGLSAALLLALIAPCARSQSTMHHSRLHTGSSCDYDRKPSIRLLWKRRSSGWQQLA